MGQMAIKSPYPVRRPLFTKIRFSIVMDQQEFTRKLFNADFHLPRNLHKMNGNDKLDAAGLKTLRGINGSLQRLRTNTRIDLSAKVSLSASEVSNPTIASLQKANKLIRQAQKDDNLPIHIHAIPMEELNFGIFSDAARAVRPDVSSRISDVRFLSRVAQGPRSAHVHD